jgi:hypothetical protein
MSTIAKLTERLDTLEQELKTLRSMTPLQAFTAGLKDASPEDVVEWLNLCQEMATALVPDAAPVVKTAKGLKTAKPRAVTNATGPKEWNVFVQATWQSMAAEKGVLYEDFEGEGDAKDKAFKKAAAALGITYQGAMKEASRRKALTEGKDAAPKAPKAKAAASVTAEVKTAEVKTAEVKTTASVGGAEATPAVLELVEAEETLEERIHREAKETGWVQIQHNGSLHYKDVDCGEVYNFPQLDVVGIYQKDGRFQPYV